MIYSIIYKSKASSTITLDEINTMLVDANYFNKKNKISGCLLYYDMQFIQLLEGDEKAVQSLYSSIKDDKRHYDIETLITKLSHGRLWNDWSMAFYNFSEDSSPTKYKRLLLESSLENANREQHKSELLTILKQQLSLLFDD